MTTADRHADVDTTGRPLDDPARQDTGGYARRDDEPGHGTESTASDATGAHRYDVAPDQETAAYGTVPSQDERHLDEHAGQRTEDHRLDGQDPDPDSSRFGSGDRTAADGTTDTAVDTTTDTRTGDYTDRHVDDSAMRTVDGDSTTDTTAAAATTSGNGDGTPSTTAAATTAASTTASTPATTAASTTAGGSGLERLVPADRVQEYTSRWDAVKGEFVDEPRQAVAKADNLVGELLDELDQLFRKQRSDLEHGLDADETSTEDLRLALRRYRSFFDRLLEL